MRLSSRIDVYLPGDTVERAPDFWDHLKSVWAPVDLGTNRVRDRVEAAAFVYEMRNALTALGIDNARSLVVDGVTVFHDARGVDGDLPDMILALSDHVSLFGDPSQELRLSVEHTVAGLRFVIDATVTTEHGREAPSARIDVVARPMDLDPRPSETADSYRARVEPLASDPKLAKTLRLQFGGFVSRLQEALGRVFTDTRIEASDEMLVGGTQDDGTPSAPVRETAPRAPRKRRRAERAVDTAVPARNFTISIEAQISALVTGPPPFAVRQRRIEDLVEDVVGALCEIERTSARSIPIAVVRRIDEANALIREHNKYYPIERNLPMDGVTGNLLELGEPWRPRPALALDDLRAEARARLAEE